MIWRTLRQHPAVTAAAPTPGANRADISTGVSARLPRPERYRDGAVARELLVRQQPVDQLVAVVVQVALNVRSVIQVSRRKLERTASWACDRRLLVGNPGTRCPRVIADGAAWSARR